MREENRENLEKLMEKVKKLLALAGNNPSEAEAIAASLKAQELIAKYNLSMTDTKKEELEIYEEQYETGVDKSWKYGLGHVVADNFRVCHYWLNRRYIVFYGYKQDVQIAIQVFEYLFKIGQKGGRAAARKQKKEFGTENGAYYSYTRGFTAGVASALEKQSTALMVVTPKKVKDSYKQYIEDPDKGFRKLSGKMRNGSEKGTRKSIYDEGYNDGRTAGGSRSLEGTRGISKR